MRFKLSTYSATISFFCPRVFDIMYIIPSPANHSAPSCPKLDYDFEKNLQRIYGYASDFSLRLVSILNRLCRSVSWRWYKRHSDSTFRLCLKSPFRLHFVLFWLQNFQVSSL